MESHADTIARLKEAADEIYGSVEAVVAKLADENLDGDVFERILAIAFWLFRDRQARIKIVEAGLPQARRFNRWPVFEEVNPSLVEIGQRFDFVCMREFAGIVGSFSLVDEFAYWLCLDARNYGRVDSQFGGEIKSNVARVRELLTVVSVVQPGSALRSQNDRNDMKLKEAHVTPGVPKLKWQLTDTAFVLLCKLQCEEGAVPFKHENSTSRNEIPWESFCALYSKKDGTPFEPQKLSNLASKLSPEPDKKTRHKAEVTQILKIAMTANESSAARITSSERITGSLSESSVSKSALGSVGSKRG